MKRSRINDSDDVNLDDLDASGTGGGDPADSGAANGDDDDQDDLPEDDDDQDDGDDTDDADDGDGADGQDDPAVAARRQGGAAGEPQGGRGNTTIRTLRAQLRETREQNRTLTQRFDDFVARGGQRQQPAQTQETVEQRNARRALLSHEERMSEDMQELRNQVTTTLHTTQLQTADATDKASFSAKTTSDPLYRKWEARVEAERAKLAGQGQFVAREAVLSFLLGKAALDARASGAGKKQRASANRRVERQTVNAGSSRNDATQSRRGSRSTLEQRLSDVPL